MPASFHAGHADALIELLSSLDDQDLADLGLDAFQIEKLDDVWEEAHDFYEHTIGRPHPLSLPSQAEDDTKPVIMILGPVTVVHANPGSIN